MAREWFSKQTIGALVDERARRDGAREALFFQGRRWSFADLARDVDAVARGLLALGVEPGVIRIGAVLLPVNTRFRTDDAAYVLGQSDATALVMGARGGSADYLGMLRALLPSLGSSEDVGRDPKLPELRRVVVLGDPSAPGTVPWHSLLEHGARVGETALRARAAAVDPDATMLLMYTSGTTGFPKGVMQGHNVLRNVVDRAFRMAITPASPRGC